MNGNAPFDVLESIASPQGNGGVPNSESAGEWCIADVKILGTTTKSGKRRYSEQCLRESVSLYEGKAVCNDHTDNPAPNDLALCSAPIRKPDDILGYFKSVRYVPGDGLRGNFHFTRRGELAESVMIASRENPKLYGFSHHVPRNGFRSHMEGNIEVIDSITQVVSVDLVTNPNTNSGLFEGVRPVSKESKTIKFSGLLESLCQLPSEKLRITRIMSDLKESMGDGADMADPAVEVGNEATKPEDKIKSGFQTMMNDIIEGYMSDGNDAQLVARIKAAAKACGMMLKGDEPKKESAEAPDSPVDKNEDASTEDDKNPDDKKESVQVDVLGDGAADLLESAGIAITPKLLKALKPMTKDQAEAILESVKAEKNRADDAEKRLGVLRPEETTKSTPRTRGSLLESAGKDGGKDKGEYKPMLLKPATVKSGSLVTATASAN